MRNKERPNHLFAIGKMQKILKISVRQIEIHITTIEVLFYRLESNTDCRRKLNIVREPKTQQDMR